MIGNVKTYLLSKKNSQSDVNSYRPHSLTSICSKIMEMTRKHILRFLSANSIISSWQYGFTPGRSTTLQLLRTMHDWTEKLDNGNEVDIVYIDFQKAFDSVPLHRLLGTRAKYGIQGKALNCIRDFLFGRKQRVVFNESYSKWARVRSGISLGSVIGPVLFIVFINSMFNASPRKCTSMMMMP